ncbi:MAG: hypothetical protein CFH44_00211 [Proteobacteria bacterium]|jgi:hypothetical protein|nr:MAG: hypothetical protein CFH44_00211 [Pseudomonadota bacterium]|tara:strand:- start:306 stop:458 length:153 start_codon:yes stop_codon:yes gene_type:complete
MQKNIKKIGRSKGTLAFLNEKKYHLKTIIKFGDILHKKREVDQTSHKIIF